jgi:hypothetical protein
MAVNNTPTPAHNEASTPAPSKPRNIAPVANNAVSQPSQQNKALLDMLSKSKAKAAALGIDWEEEKRIVFNKTVADSALTAQMVGQINTDLAKAKGNKAS